MAKPTQPQLLSEFIDGLTKAIGASWQLCHAHQKPQFLPIRDKLELVKRKCVDIAVRGSIHAE